MDSKNRIKLSFIWTYIFGLVAHGYVYLNTTYNHDGAMIYLADDDWKISIGRYIGVLYRTFRTRYSAPWLTGILAIGYLALSAYLVTEIFDINRKSIIAAISACFATNYSLIFMNASTIHESDTYMLATLLYVCAAYLLIKAPSPVIKNNNSEKLKVLTGNKYVRLGIASICMGLAMGIYQAYVTMTFAIVSVYIVVLALNNCELKAIITKVVDSAITYIAGGILYCIGLKLCTAITHVEMYQDGHNSLTSVFSLDGWHPLEGLAKAYNLYFHQFFDISTKFNYKFLVAANIVLILGNIILVLAIAISKKIKATNLIAILLVFVLMPGILGALYILTLVGHIMMCQYIVVYLFPLVVVNYLQEDGKAQENQTGSSTDIKKDISPETTSHEAKNENSKTRIISLVCLICTFVVTYYSTAFANAYYVEQHLEYQSTREYMSKLINDIERMPDYVPGETEVIFIGLPQGSHIAHTRTGYDGFEADSKGWNYEFTSSITGYYTYVWFVNDILNANMLLGGEEEAISYSQLPNISEMPEYPSADSIIMLDGKVIAKIGNWY